METSGEVMLGPKNDMSIMFRLKKGHAWMSRPVRS